MKRFMHVTAAAVIALAASVVAVTPAHASTTAYACPVSSGWQATNPDSYDPSTLTSTTDLVGCQNPFARPGGLSNREDVFVYFNALSPTAFNGMQMKIHVEGNPFNSGYLVSLWTDKNNAHSSIGAQTIRQYGIWGSSSHSSVDVTVTARNAAEKAAILAGDFVVMVGVVGGTGSATESVDSVSIPYSQSTVSFDSNGATSTMSSQGADPASALTANTLSRPGYTFTGWNTAADGTGTGYSDTATFPFATDTTLYAQWAAVPVSAATSTSTDGSVLASTGNQWRTPFGLFGVLSGFGILLLITQAIRNRKAVNLRR